MFDDVKKGEKLNKKQLIKSKTLNYSKAKPWIIQKQNPKLWEIWYQTEIKQKVIKLWVIKEKATHQKQNYKLWEINEWIEEFKEQYQKYNAKYNAIM